MKRLSKPLQLEELESRTLSTTAASLAPPALAAAVVGSSAVPPVPLVSGTIQGNFTVSYAIPDVGAHYTLNGAGTLGAMGSVTATGSLDGLGFIVQGNAQGVLTLTDAYGTLTLHLSGPLQPGFSPLPDHFYFSVWGGTGAYKHTHVSGRLDLQLNPHPVAANGRDPVAADGRAVIAQGGGTFTMTFHQWWT